MSIFEQIEQLKKQGDDRGFIGWSKEAIEHITNLEKAAFEIQAIEDIGKLSGIALIIKDFEGRIEYINKQLLTDNELLSDKGRELKARKEWLREFIDIFANNLKSKAVLEDGIKDELT
jgi:hypothetical protein